MKEYNSAGAQRSTQFKLDGKVYKFKFPPFSALVNLAGVGAELPEESRAAAQIGPLLEIFWRGLRKEDAVEIDARLGDPDDGLDEGLILTIVSDLFGEMGKETDELI